MSKEDIRRSLEDQRRSVKMLSALTIRDEGSRSAAMLYNENFRASTAMTMATPLDTQRDTATFIENGSRLR